MRRSSFGTTAIWADTGVGASVVIIAANIVLGEYVEDVLHPLTLVK